MLVFGTAVEVVTKQPKQKDGKIGWLATGYYPYFKADDSQDHSRNFGVDFACSYTTR